MMNCKIAITVPSTTGVNKPAPEVAAVYVEKAMQTFARLFGGFTTLTAKGGWFSNEMGLVVEDVFIVYSFCDRATLKASLAQVKALALEIKKAMTQECVAVEIDGKGIVFISDEESKLAA
jgi:hypothetical protein